MELSLESFEESNSPGADLSYLSAFTCRAYLVELQAAISFEQSPSLYPEPPARISGTSSSCNTHITWSTQEIFDMSLISQSGSTFSRDVHPQAIKADYFDQTPRARSDSLGQPAGTSSLTTRRVFDMSLTSKPDCTLNRAAGHQEEYIPDRTQSLQTQSHRPETSTSDYSRQQKPLKVCHSIYSRIKTVVTKVSSYSVRNRGLSGELGTTTSETAAMLRAPFLEYSVPLGSQERPSMPTRQPTKVRCMPSGADNAATTLYGTMEYLRIEGGINMGIEKRREGVGGGGDASGSVESIMGGRRQREPWDYESKVW